MRRALERIGAKTPRESRASAPVFSSAPMRGNMSDGQKRRFVRDGEVPVMVVSGSRPPEGQSQRRNAAPVNEHVEAAQVAMRAGKAQQEAAERALKEARDTIQDLRTKLGHIALARDEALEVAKRAEMARAALAHELDVMAGRLAVEVSARARAERLAAQVAPEEPAPEPVAAVELAPWEVDPNEEPPPPKRGRGRPRKGDAPAPAPALIEGEDAPVRRGRGRPRKVASEATAAAEPSGDEIPAPRKRGRPPGAATLAKADQPKRKPGRPRIEREPEPVKWWVNKKPRGKADKAE
jgi:hypothetical protein